MRRLRTHRNKRSAPLAELPLTPMIDVFATLLVIFMVAAPMVHTGIKVTLPQGSTNEVGKEQEFVVTLTKEGGLFFNTYPVKKEDLATTVQKELHQQLDTPVYVRADTTVEYGSVVEIVDTLKQAGIRYVAMSTKPRTAA